MSGHGVYDPGLQPERTLLAWRRTCLSFAIASLIGARYTLDVFGLFAIGFGVFGSALAAAAYFAAARGYQRAQRTLHESHSSGTSGAPVLLATLAALLVGAACAVFIAFGSGTL